MTCVKYRRTPAGCSHMHTETHTYRSMGIRMNCYCLTCQNISRRPKPIDLLCTGVSTHFPPNLINSFFLSRIIIGFSFFPQPLFPFLFPAAFYLHITSNPDKHCHTPCFCLHLRRSPSSCFAISYYANLRPTHTPRRKQLVKGQAV